MSAELRWKAGRGTQSTRCKGMGEGPGGIRGKGGRQREARDRNTACEPRYSLDGRADCAQMKDTGGPGCVMVRAEAAPARAGAPQCRRSLISRPGECWEAEGASWRPHAIRCPRHSLGVCPRPWAAPDSWTDDLPCTWCRSFIRTLPITTWTCFSGQGVIWAGPAGGANQDGSPGACPQATSQRALLLWCLGHQRTLPEPT